MSRHRWVRWVGVYVVGGRFWFDELYLDIYLLTGRDNRIVPIPLYYIAKYELEGVKSIVTPHRLLDLEYLDNEWFYIFFLKEACWSSFIADFLYLQFFFAHFAHNCFPPMNFALSDCWLLMMKWDALCLGHFTWLMQYYIVVQ